MARKMSPSASFASGFCRHLAEKIDNEPGEKTHDEDIGDENENVEQQSAILFFE